ncbi:MAG: hypothetical protein AAGC58_11540, partial [Asticcacaulis sp.]
LCARRGGRLEASTKQGWVDDGGDIFFPFALNRYCSFPLLLVLLTRHGLGEHVRFAAKIPEVLLR